MCKTLKWGRKGRKKIQQQQITHSYNKMLIAIFKKENNLVYMIWEVKFRPKWVITNNEVKPKTNKNYFNSGTWI